MKRFLAVYFSLRGYTLAALFLLLLWVRLRIGTPLRPGFLALIAAGLLLRLWAGSHLGPHGNGSRAEAPHLARGGPYRFSRHPLYVSNLLIGFGIVLFSGLHLPFPALAFLLALALHHEALALWEEANLRRILGDAYVTYAHHTARWAGRPRRRSGGEGSEAAERGASLPQTLRWQGRNLAYAAIAVLIVAWAARR